MFIAMAMIATSDNKVFGIRVANAFKSKNIGKAIKSEPRMYFFGSTGVSQAIFPVWPLIVA